MDVKLSSGGTRIVSACFILLLKGNGAGLDSVYRWLSKYVSNNVNLRQNIEISVQYS